MDDDFFAALVRFNDRLAPAEIRVDVAESCRLLDCRRCRDVPCPVCDHRLPPRYLRTLALTRFRPSSIAVETSAGSKPSITALAQSAVPARSRAAKNGVANFIRFSSPLLFELLSRSIEQRRCQILFGTRQVANLRNQDSCGARCPAGKDNDEGKPADLSAGAEISAAQMYNSLKLRPDTGRLESRNYPQRARDRH